MKKLVILLLIICGFTSCQKNNGSTNPFKLTKQQKNLGWNKLEVLDPDQVETFYSLKGINSYYGDSLFNLYSQLITTHQDSLDEYSLSHDHIRKIKVKLLRFKSKRSAMRQLSQEKMNFSTTFPFYNVDSKRRVRTLNWYEVSTNDNVVYTDSTIELSSKELSQPKIYKRANGEIIKVTHTSGVITGDEISYGILEADIKLPRGKNLWSSFWLYISDGKSSNTSDGTLQFGGNEIDIFECFTGDDDSYFTPTPKPYTSVNFSNNNELDGITSSIHGKIDGKRFDPITNNGTNVINKVLTPGNEPSDKFYKYKMVWTPTELKISMDGVEIFNYSGDKIPYHKMKIIFKVGLDYNAGDWDNDYNSRGTTSPMVIKNLNYIPLGSFYKK